MGPGIRRTLLPFCLPFVSPVKPENQDGRFCLPARLDSGVCQLHLNETGHKHPNLVFWRELRIDVWTQTNVHTVFAQLMEGEMTWIVSSLNKELVGKVSS